MSAGIKIHRIEVPTPYYVGPVNLHLLLGDAVVLVDAGPQMPEMGLLLQRELGRRGVRLKDLDAILITHGHLDHFGMAGYLKEKSGARVLAHAGDRYHIEGFPKTHLQALERMREYSGRHGFSPTLFRDVERDYHQSMEMGSPVELDGFYSEGEPLEFGNIRIEPVFTPGHTEGSTCLYESRTQSLFTGDTVLENVTPISFFRGRRSDLGLQRYLESLAKLRTRPVRRVHPGHRKNFSGFTRALDQIERHIGIRRKRVLDALPGGGTRTAAEIAVSAFGNRRAAMVRWVGFVETLGLLETLEEKQEVLRLEEKEGVRYRRR